MTTRWLGAMDVCDARTQGASICGHIGATEDEAACHPACQTARASLCWKLLQRQRAEHGGTRVDRAMEAALPLDHHVATRFDRANDAAIANPQVRVSGRDQLDSATNPDARRNAGGKDTRTRSIHTL
jgi:hypothetical protein